MKKRLSISVILVVLLGFGGYAHAITTTLVFTGECDDCAFDPGIDPLAPGFDPSSFDPLGDGFSEAVTATLFVDGLSVDNGMIDFRGAGTVVFSYGGSSLINPFTMADPFRFSNGLMTNGEVAAGFEFELASSVNVTDPANPRNFDFPGFCTELGNAILSPRGACDDIGLVTFLLDSEGLWSVSGTVPFDIGFGGQFTVAAVPLPGALLLFASGLIGLVGLGRARTLRNA